MGLYTEYVLPYCIELSCGMQSLTPARRKVLAGLHGTVLEIGFGSGLNVPLYPPEVSRVLGVEPSERARGMAQTRLRASRCPVEFVGLDAEAVDADSGIADTALSTFTLCTIPDVARALAEVKRILRPGGRLHFLEHGRAPDPAVQRWQDRLNGLAQAVAGGCHLNRDIPELLRRAGFRLESLEEGYQPSTPRTHGYFYSGVAVAS